MMQKFRKLSLESQLFFSFMAVSVCLLLLSLSITLFSTITRQRQEIDKNISALAAYVASMDNVVSMLENGYPDGSANEELDSLSENFPDLNVIAIYNTTGLRFYHTNRKETGETFVDGEEEAILKGSQPYITIGYGTNGSQRRAFHSEQRRSDHRIRYSVGLQHLYLRADPRGLSYLFIGSDGHAARQHPSVSRTRLPSPGFPDGTSSDGASRPVSASGYRSECTGGRSCRHGFHRFRGLRKSGGRKSLSCPA